jgi:addiction module HigA family antidote
MHNPPHPGEVLREYLGSVTVTEAAAKLGVNRVTLSRVISGSSGISADMAYRLSLALGTSPEMWAGMQMQFDLYQASKLKRPKIERIAA